MNSISEAHYIEHTTRFFSWNIVVWAKVGLPGMKKMTRIFEGLPWAGEQFHKMTSLAETGDRISPRAFNSQRKCFCVVLFFPPLSTFILPSVYLFPYVSTCWLGFSSQLRVYVYMVFMILFLTVFTTPLSFFLFSCRVFCFLFCLRLVHSAFLVFMQHFVPHVCVIFFSFRLGLL